MLIAYDAAPLLQPKTGVGHYTDSLLKALLAYDADLEFNLFALTRANDISGLPQSPRVHVRRLGLPARLIVTAWEMINWPPADNLISGSLVHGTNFWVPPLRRIPSIVTIHDLTFHYYPEFCTPQVQRYRWIVPKVLSRCALVLTPSETIKQQIASELSFPEDRIRVTYEGVRATLHTDHEDADLARSIGIRHPYVLFAGTQEPRKNLDRLLSAFRQLDLDLQLVVVGPPGWGSVNLPAVAQKMKMDEKVVFAGYLPDEKLGPLLKGARAFVFPTLYEGFGMPPLEAMQLGVPVVSSNGGALPEVLGNAPFYCDPLDVSSIADAIQRAVQNEAARELAIKEGLHQVSKYSWERTAGETLAAYREVVSQ